MNPLFAVRYARIIQIKKVIKIIKTSEVRDLKQAEQYNCFNHYLSGLFLGLSIQERALLLRILGYIYIYMCVRVCDHVPMNSKYHRYCLNAILEKLWEYTITRFLVR